MTDVRRISTVIVDDEAPARLQLHALLESEADIEVIGQAAGGTAAIALIRERKPDLVFLDVEMPGCNGFEVLRALGPELPMVIFVTAYDQHAIEAFDFAALDYLLKPVVESRFRIAVRRAVARIRDSRVGELAAQVTTLLDRVAAIEPEHLPLWTDGRVIFVPIDDIDMIHADDDYIRVHVGANVYITRETMAMIESRLPNTFLRVHRSCIINRSRIREIQPWVKGDYVIILKGGMRVTSGRTYRERVRAILPPRSHPVSD